MDEAEIRSFALSANTIFECVQVVPMGTNTCAIAFMLFDQEYTTRISIIFRVEGFDPKRSQLLMLREVWLLSIAAPTEDTLMALDATASIHTLSSGRHWTTEKISDKSLWRLCRMRDGSVVALGDGGTVLHHDGATWNLRRGAPNVQLLDADGGLTQPIHVCGDEGYLGKLQGSTLTPVELNRGGMFRGVDICDDGTIRVAGGSDEEGPVTLRIKDEEIFEIKNSGNVYFSVRTFRGQSFWGDEADVYRESRNAMEALEAAEMGADLRCDDRYLYCTGDDCAHRFDGREWKTIELMIDEEVGFHLSQL